MHITIHRGCNQIGGCVTEYEHNGWRLFVDYGEQLPGAPMSGDLKIDGLTHGDLSHSALLLTHYHSDHIGNIDKIPDAVPIYMGRVGHKIAYTLEDYKSNRVEKARKIKDRLELVKTFAPLESFKFGDFKILPITIDHSAFDAYAFRIEVAGVSVFHTGDFRTHGFRSGKFEKLITKYVGHVDYLVCEGTNVARGNIEALSEHDLQKEFEQQFRRHKINIVYASSTNIDRLFSLYHAACHANLRFYVDEYQKKILDAVIKTDTLWVKSSLYHFDEPFLTILRCDKQDNGEFEYTPGFHDAIKMYGGVFMARTNKRFENLLSKFPTENKQIYLSKWKGYVEEGNQTRDEKLVAALGNDFITLHTSGHCDMESIHKLIALLQPKGIIPIHTDSPENFAALFSADAPVLLLKDGDTFSPIQP
jgi:ribonuclease J